MTTKRKPRATLFQHLRAPQSTNGNPRRCFVVYSAKGIILSVIDEGYRGTPEACKKLARLPDIEVSPAVYRNFLSWSSED